MPVDRFDHQLADVVQHVITLRAFGADPRRHLRLCRLLTEVARSSPARKINGFVGLMRFQCDDRQACLEASGP
jgi:hypothetical protein